jgi:hypothetical protein
MPCPNYINDSCVAEQRLIELNGSVAIKKALTLEA